MKKRLFAGFLVAAVLAALSAVPAQAGCGDNGTCITAKKTAVVRHHAKRTAFVAHKSRKHIASHRARTSSRRLQVAASGAGPHHAASAGRVVGLIQSMAPSYGVPTWFALRIAKVESNYNPRLRGRAGEYGVYQLKCATAKGIGFSGNCSALLDPAVNVRWGLKHLSIAMSKSRGNLRLAASMHNGGLGRKTEIRGYVAKIF